jgi:digeranylgeranylglycerophospholipid reductase
VGDAAHQADPLTAGGINLGMIGADLAMQVAVPALRSGDVSAKRLHEYEERWQERFGKMHRALYQMRKILTEMEEERLNALIEAASRLPIEQMTPGQILLTLLKTSPRLLVEARTLLLTGLVMK